MDDVGWMDPGFNGGGDAVGNATPHMDKLANEGLVLTSAYSTPRCSPTRASIMTGQNPLHHGILRPPMYDEAGGLDGAITMPLHPEATRLHHPGRRQMAHGREPGLAAAERRLRRLCRLPRRLRHVHRVARHLLQSGGRAVSPTASRCWRSDDFSHYKVHCTPGDKEKCENGKLIELNYIKELDKHWLDTSLTFLDKMKGKQAAVLPLPRDARLPLRQLSVRRVGRQVDGAHRVRRLHGADGLHPRRSSSPSCRRSASSRTR